MQIEKRKKYFEIECICFKWQVKSYFKKYSMKKIIVCFVLSVLTLAAVAQQKVAVYVTCEDEGISKVLGSKLVSAIARSEKYSAVERTAAFLAELNKEQEYQSTGAVDDTELSRLGKQFGVQLICVADVLNVFGGQYLSVRLIDVESAQVKQTASSVSTISSLSDLISASTSVSTELLNHFENDGNANMKKVAVYVTPNETSKEIGKVFGDKLVAGFTSSGRYIAIERTNSFISQLNKEQKYQREGAVDDDDISRLGRQSGVRYVCVTDITDVMNEKFVSVRLVDVETAEIANTYEIGGTMNSMENCLTLATKVADELSKGTLAEQAEEARLKAEEEARKKAEEEARIRAEEEKKRAEEARKQQEIEENYRRQFEQIKKDAAEDIKRGYVIVGHYMVCLKVLGVMKYSDANKKYSMYGYDDWRLPKEKELNYIAKKMGGVLQNLMCYGGTQYEVFNKKVGSFFSNDNNKYWCYHYNKGKWYKYIYYETCDVANNVDVKSEAYKMFRESQETKQDCVTVHLSDPAYDDTIWVQAYLDRVLRRNVVARLLLIREVK